MKQYLFVTMPDFSVWRVPVKVIADHRTRCAVSYYDQTPEDALAETESVFRHDGEVTDWAANNMNWAEVKEHAVLVRQGEVDFDDGWANGEKTLSNGEMPDVD